MSKAGTNMKASRRSIIYPVSRFVDEHWAVSDGMVDAVEAVGANMVASGDLPVDRMLRAFSLGAVDVKGLAFG